MPLVLTRNDYHIDDYRMNFDGGAKAYLFKVNFTGMPKLDMDVSRFISYYVKSTQVPSYSRNETVIPYTNLDIKTASSAVFSDWPVTFYVDKNSLIPEILYNWISLCGYETPTNYMANIIVSLLGDSGETTISYDLWGAWPKSVGALNLDYGSNDIATLDVTFAYQFYQITYL